METPEELWLDPYFSSRIEELSEDQAVTLWSWLTENAYLPELRDAFARKVWNKDQSRSRTERRDRIRLTQVHLGQESLLGSAAPFEGVPIHHDRPTPPASTSSSDDVEADTLPTAPRPRGPFPGSGRAASARDWLWSLYTPDRRAEILAKGYKWQAKVFGRSNGDNVIDVQNAVDAIRQDDPLGIAAFLAVAVCGYSWHEASLLDAIDLEDEHWCVYRLPAISKLGLSGEALRKHVERRVLPRLRKRLKRPLPWWAHARPAVWRAGRWWTELR